MRIPRILACSLAFALTFQVATGAPPSLDAGRYLVVSLLDRPTIWVLSLPSLTVVDSIPPHFRAAELTPVNPGRVLAFPEFDTRDQYSEVTVQTGEVEARGDIHWPFIGQLNSDGSKLYVTTLDGGELLAVDPTTGAITGNLDASPRPGYMDFDPVASELYVADNSNGLLSIYSGSTDQLSRRFRAESIGMVAVAQGKVYWPDDSSVRVSDPTTFAFLHRVFLQNSVMWMAPSADRTRLFVLTQNALAGHSAFYTIDTATDTVLATSSFAGGAWRFIVDESAQKAYITLFEQRQIGVLDLATNTMTFTALDRGPFAVSLVDVP